MTNVALLFPGQGAQKVGMAADFAGRFPAAAAVFQQANEILGYDLRSICFQGPDEDLTLTRNCQPAIFTAGAAIIAALEESGHLDRASIAQVAGLSLGEYTALWFAGALSFEHGLRLVAMRGAAMQDASDDPRSGMVSLLGADEGKAAEIAAAAAGDDVLVVANILSPVQVVLSGHIEACERVPEIAKEMGVRRAIPLKVAGAFHSPLMEPAAVRLQAELERVEIVAPTVPVVGNVTGRVMSGPDEIRECLAAQVVAPVRWADSMVTMRSSEIGTFIEPGPGRVLTGLMKKIDRDATGRNYETLSDLEGEDSA